MLKYNLLYVQKHWGEVKHIVQNYGIYENIQNYVQNYCSF